MFDRLAAKFGTAISILSFLLVAAALLLVLGRLGVTWKSFDENDKSISGLQGVVTICAIIVGAAVSYFRFFAHRLFVQRANLTMAVNVHPMGAAGNWHTVQIWIENHGSLVIGVRDLKWECAHYSKDGLVGQARGNKLFKPNFGDGAQHWVVDSGETEHIMMKPISVEHGTLMSLYSATLTDRSWRTWTCYCSVTNSARADPVHKSRGRE
jgi:hypothetical protein